MELILIDSCLPIGSFSYSYGLEASNLDLIPFLKSSLHSNSFNFIQFPSTNSNSNLSAFTSNPLILKSSLAQANALNSLYSLDLKNTHFQLIFTLLCMSYNIDLARIRYLYLFMNTKSILSSAVRLNLIGPLKSHKICIEFLPFIEQLVESHHQEQEIQNKYPLDDHFKHLDTCFMTTAPLIDIIQGLHPRLYSRLFNN